jgi:trk system potassium uptake protein TrkH
LFISGFAFIILIGTFLLTLPFATVDGDGLPFIDALFTATSAVCVTGLVVVDTGTAFTPWGQAVILLLIQIGGMGFMTFGTLFAVLLGKRIYFKERLILQEALNQYSIEGIIRMVLYIAAVTFFFQSLGAILLTIRFAQEMELPKAAFFGIFHAISAFNNAGFDLFGNFASLTKYTGDFFINAVIAGLLIIGGIGFAVTLDIFNHRHFAALALNSKITLITTAILLVSGTVLIFLLERGNPATLGPLDYYTQAQAAFFQSATARTAGFNTIDIASLLNPTLLVLMVLMFIGAASGSTGGGIKVTTFSLLLLKVGAIVKGQEDPSIFSRRVGSQIVGKAMAIFFASLLLVLTSAFLLTMFEEAEFLPSLFEVVSAFATVGLSMGLTPELSPAGKIVIILTMFCGRLGPLTIAMALATRGLKEQFRYPEEKLLVG